MKKNTSNFPDSGFNRLLPSKQKKSDIKQKLAKGEKVVIGKDIQIPSQKNA